MSDRPMRQSLTPFLRPFRSGRWLRYGILALVSVILGLGGLVGLAGSGPVLRMMTPLINETVSTATETTFELGRVEGSLWTGLTLDRVTMGRADDGFHLALANMAVDWSPLALLSGRVHIRHIGLGTVSVFLPGGGGTDDDMPETPDEEGGFALPLAIGIDSFDLPEIAVVDPETGKSFLYSLYGRAAMGTNLSGRVTVDLQPLDGGTDRLAIDLDFDGPGQRLIAGIDGALDREGIVMTLAGINPEDASNIKISLDGSGPADDWNGVLDLSAEGYGALAGDVAVQLSSDTVIFDFNGDLQPLEIISDLLPEMLHRKILLGIGGAFELSGKRLVFDRLSVEMPNAVAATGTADINLADSMVSAELNARLHPVLSALIDDGLSWEQLDLRATAEGTFAAPGIGVTVTARDVLTPLSMIGELTATGRLDGLPAGDGSRTATLSLATTGSVWSDDASGESLSRLLGAAQELSLQAGVASDFSAFSLRDMVFAAPQMRLQGQADITDQDGQFVVSDAALTGNLDDLAALAPLTGLDLSGVLDLELSDLVWTPDRGGEGKIALRARQAGFGSSDLDRIVGPEPAITGTIALAPNLDMAIDLPGIDTAGMDGGMKVDLQDDFTRLAAKGEFDLAPNVVPPDIGVAIRPSRLGITLAGDIAAPRGQVSLQVPGLEAGGYIFENVVLTSAPDWSDSGVLSLVNRGQFGFGGQKYDVAANIDLPEDALRIRDLSLRGADIDLTGDIVAPDYAVPLRGRVTLSRFDASLLAGFGVANVNGLVTGDIDLDAGGTGQGMAMHVRATGLQIASDPATGSGAGAGGDPVKIDEILLDGSVADAFGAADISASLTGQDILAGDLAIQGLSLAATGRLEALAITLDGRGTYQGKLPLTVKSTATLAINQDIRLSAERFDAVISDQSIHLRQPLVFVLGGDGAQQLRADLAVGSGTLVAAFDQTANRQSLSADIVLDAVALGPWGRIAGYDTMTGTAALTATLREAVGAMPVADIRGQITGITAKAVRGLKPFEMQVDLSLKDNLLAGQALLGNADVTVLSAKGTVPLRISVLEQNFAPDLGAPVSASLRINGEIAEFWPYVPAPDHLLSGKINLALDIAGTLGDIRWSGNVALDDGSYENMVYGTILDGLTLAGTFDDKGLSVPSITATDGGTGTVEGSAQLVLKDGGDMAYEMAMKLRNAAVSRKDELRFWADVDASVAGNRSTAEIKSTVTVQRGEVDLTLALPESVASIEVANLPGADEDPNADTEEEDGFSGNLDVTVSVPGRLFVRGRGLDSEWGGTLQISGTTDEPSVVGQLSALRGQLDVIGKTFVIRDSKITFAGETPPDPMLDIKGVYTTSDLEVTAGFQGHASDPELVLTSNPSLPEDEILSQVLFGKSQGSLSAIEAVQLASAVNEISGGGSGLDVLGSIRRFIGADVLRVGGGEDGPNVKVGKYLADGVYVGTKAGTTPGSSGVEVEIEVTPNISVTSESTEIDSKAGIQYRLDY